ncbi:hypothetical protein MNBD_NITROSPIRAE01-943 [hydrothermal vent metagenome]|uniref:Uncharacterized protein n=1 Tax=hydrothermal vent metagenome TaxID=652676 RepID=A0A3B1C7W4_9ZZZZ
MRTRVLVFFSLWSHFVLVFLLCFPVLLNAAELNETAGSSQLSRDEIEIQSGVFLVADLKIMDAHFGKTVVLILHHDAGGSSGLVINRPTEQVLKDLLPTVEWPVPVEAIFEGGPVLRDETLALLFRSKNTPQNMEPVFKDVYVTRKARVFAGILQDETQSKGHRLYAGYAGWSPGQLEAERRRGDWHVLFADVDVLFDEDVSQTWSEMFARTQRRFVKKDPQGLHFKTLSKNIPKKD